MSVKYALNLEEMGRLGFVTYLLQEYLEAIEPGKISPFPQPNSQTAGPELAMTQSLHIDYFECDRGLHRKKEGVCKSPWNGNPDVPGILEFRRSVQEPSFVPYELPECR